MLAAQVLRALANTSSGRWWGLDAGIYCRLHGLFPKRRRFCLYSLAESRLNLGNTAVQRPNIHHTEIIPHMKSSRTRTAILAFLCGTTLLHADYLILKNGNKVEGNILSESPESVRMKYRLTPKIWDEKDFSRAEIDQVVKQRPEEVEIVELRKILPTEDLLTADKYEQIIQDRLRPFVNQYKGTPEAKEAEEIIASLQDEKSKVSNGGIKLEGRWLNAAEARGEEYNIEAYKLLAKMRSHMAVGEWLEALRVFESFTKKKPGYAGSTYYPTAITDALTCMDKWEPTLSKMAQEQPSLDKARKDGLSKLDETERARTKAAIEEERAKWQAQSEADRRAQSAWIAPYRYDLPSILNVQKKIVAERSRLSSINLDELRVRNEAVTMVYRKIGQEDYTGGAAAFERISVLSNSTDYRDIVNDLRNRLMALYGTLVRRQMSATQGAVAGSSAIGGAVSTGEDERVARILAEASGQAPAPAPAAGAPAATTPAPAAAPQPVAAPAPVAPAPNPPMVQQPAAAPVPMMMPPAEESNTQTYIMIGMGVVLLLLVVLLLKKK